MNANFNIEQYLTERVMNYRIRKDMINGLFAKIDAHRNDDAYTADVASWKRKAMIDTNKNAGAYAEICALAKAHGLKIVFNKEDNTFHICGVETTVSA